jgi:hypothetical protein
MREGFRPPHLTTPSCHKSKQFVVGFVAKVQVTLHASSKYLLNGEWMREWMGIEPSQKYPKIDLLNCDG